jgi:hypothetical protein
MGTREQNVNPTGPASEQPSRPFRATDPLLSKADRSISLPHDAVGWIGFGGKTLQIPPSRSRAPGTLNYECPKFTLDQSDSASCDAPDFFEPQAKAARS